MTLDQVPAAIALLGTGGEVERATTLFAERFGDGNGELTAHRSAVERILSGHLDRVSVEVGAADAELSAVVDADGAPHALLTVAVADQPAHGDRESRLDEAIESSAAIVWLKSLDGRYLAVNQRFEEQLRTSADRVCGKADTELDATESIEGMRRRDDDNERQEPLELEYTVAPFDGQPGFAVLRFALRDESGEPTGVCGVAAPLADARLARAECERLMRIERWGRLDEVAICEELLDDWGLTRVTGAVSGGDVRSDFERLEQELAEARAETLTLRGALEVAEAEAQRARTAIASEDEPGWDAASQRALAAAVARAADWRSALKESVKAVGEKGRWDAAVAWCPDERRGFMRCAASWIRADSDLEQFETRTWQHRLDVSGTEFGRARSRVSPTCVLELESTENELLRAAAERGIRAAVLVPIRDEHETIGMLELLSSTLASPDSDLMTALEAIALQLGGVARLLNLAASPHWGIGRL